MSKRFTNNGIVIIDHLKKDLIYIDGDENLLDLAEYVDRLQYENEQLKYDRDNCRKQQARQANKIHKLLNESEELKQKVDFYKDFQKDARELEKENEQLKQDNDDLIYLLKNQSMIIQEFHLKLMDYELKEPIVLTKEDLEVMGKAISYYSHGRCPE